MTSPWIKQHETLFGSFFGPFRLIGFLFPNGSEHAALIKGDPFEDDRPLVRLQSCCVTGTAFAATLCDCKQQLDLSLQAVSDEGAGIVLYMDEEGRGYGLTEKIRQLSLINDGSANTATAAPVGDKDADRRDYNDAFAILEYLLPGRSIRLLTNNPKKINAFEAHGWDVERLPVETAPTDNNREYLRVKKEIMGHLLTQV